MQVDECNPRFEIGLESSGDDIALTVIGNQLAWHINNIIYSKHYTQNGTDTLPKPPVLVFPVNFRLKECVFVDGVNPNIDFTAIHTNREGIMTRKTRIQKIRESGKWVLSQWEDVNSGATEGNELIYTGDFELSVEAAFVLDGWLFKALKRGIRNGS